MERKSCVGRALLSLRWKDKVGIVSYLGHGPGWVSEGEKDPAAHWHEQSRVKAGLFLPQSAPLPVCQKHVSYPFPMIAGTAFDEDDLIFLQLTAPLFAASKAVWSPILENLLTQVSPLSLQAAVQDPP